MKKKRDNTAAERAKRYRERKLAKKDPDAAARKAEQEEEKKRIEKEEKEKEEKRKEEKEQEKEQKIQEMEETLRMALAGTIESLAVGVHAVWMRKDAPHLGTERAGRIADLWTPLLAPKLAESDLKNLPLILAGASTTGIILEWVHEQKQTPTIVKKDETKA
jgi:hypothetical protein